MNKPCKSCGILKDLEEFYTHQGMTDGRLNICKECKKAYEHERRALGFKQGYERIRSQRPKRKAYMAKRTKIWAKKHPKRRKAQYAVSNAIRDGRLVKGSICENCGSTERICAHHEDYNKPFEICWLCARCHIRMHLAR